MAEFPLPEGVEDLTGRQFGRLTVTGWHFKKNGARHWICDCSCGKTKALYHGTLVGGTGTSCGCYRTELATQRIGKAIAARTRHGLSNSDEYKAWENMKSRCKPNFKQAANYAEKGITVYKEWAEDFMAFYNHIGPMPEKGLTVERINNNLGYFPGNVKWGTRQEQALNKDGPIFVECFGKRLCLSHWARELGMNQKTFQQCYSKYGLTIPEIIARYNIQYPPPTAPPQD